MCGLFISRWVLAALGKTDFGLYGVVGGMMVIALLAFTRRQVRARLAAVGCANGRSDKFFCMGWEYNMPPTCDAD